MKSYIISYIYVWRIFYHKIVILLNINKIYPDFFRSILIVCFISFHLDFNIFFRKFYDYKILYFLLENFYNMLFE